MREPDPCRVTSLAGAPNHHAEDEGRVIDPYELLGLTPEADDQAIKSAWRQAAKTAHPDQGGDVEAFGRLQAAHDLLRDPVRRKLYDDTGYDPQLADPRDLKGLLMIETLVNEVLLDEREPGSFDPVAAMRRRLSDDLVKSRFHILELERHRTRIRQHMDRLARRHGADVLGSMLRARSQSIAEAIRAADAQVEAIEQAYAMLDGYRYDLEPQAAPPDRAPALPEEAPPVALDADDRRFAGEGPQDDPRDEAAE